MSPWHLKRSREELDVCRQMSHWAAGSQGCKLSTGRATVSDLTAFVQPLAQADFRMHDCILVKESVYVQLGFAGLIASRRPICRRCDTL